MREGGAMRAGLNFDEWLGRLDFASSFQHARLQMVIACVLGPSLVLCGA